MGRFQTGNQFCVEYRRISIGTYLILNVSFINDLDEDITSKVLTFADDTKNKSDADR